MRYYCVTPRELPWPLPSFMTPVSTVPAGDGVLNLGERYPDLAGRGSELGEYATLFAIRRLLQEQWTNGRPPAADKMIGLSHYRRFAVVKPVGKVSGIYSVVTPEEFAAQPQETFLPRSGTLVLPTPAHLGAAVVTRYGMSHHVRDLLHFFGIAVDLGVLTNEQAAAFLGQPVLVPLPSVGIYPAEWLVETLEKLEGVVEVFEKTVAVRHEGYQQRAIGFCLERLHAPLLVSLWDEWDPQRRIANRPTVVSADGVYRDGDE